jgi:hypothetical protein
MERVLPSLYYVSNMSENEPVDWEDSVLRYGALNLKEREWDVSSPNTTNDQRVKSSPVVQKVRNFGNTSKPRVHKRKRKTL